MLALLRKEAREALVGLLVLLPLLSWIAIHTGTRIVLPGSQDHLMLVAIFAVAIGVCHGIGEFAIEERNTWRYLVHRSTGYRGAFMAKLTVDWVVLALITVIPIGVHAAWIVWFTDDAQLALWNRYFEILTTAAIAVGAHAIAVFASQLRRPTWLRFTIALAGTIGLLVASTFVTLAPYDSAFGPAARYLLWIAAVSLLLYAISFRMFVAGCDDDRAFSGKLGVGVVACTLALLAPSFVALTGAVETPMLKEIVSRQPDIWRGKDSQLHLTQTFGMSSQTVTDLLRDSGPVISRVFARTRVAKSPSVDATRSLPPAASVPFEFGSAWDEIRQRLLMGDRQTQGDVWLAKRGGKVAIVQHFRGTSTRRLLMLGKGPDNGELSSLAIHIEGPDTICIVDPQDRSMWLLVPDAPEPSLERVSLPDNDGFVRVERTLHEVPFESDDRWQVVAGHWVVVGEHGIYQWGGSRFTLANRPKNEVMTSNASPRDRDYAVDITRPDALEPTVVVRDVKTGVSLFEHSYTNEFDLRTAAAYACSLVRPTACGVVSAFQDVPDDVSEFDMVIDPLLTGARRLWLLALNVLLAAVFARRAWRRGAVGDPRRVFEALAILLLGMPAVAVLALVEPRRRAARKVVVETAPREQLLISSV